MENVRYKRVQCLSQAGLHHMAYKEWGDPANSRVLVCVHGLTRVSDDFDALAADLCSEYRVVCPDVVGRGRSDWLRDPRFYQVPQYVSDMVTLLARIEASTVDWVGTSMGGLIGMGLASLPGNPIRRLVLNDVGAALNPVALARIGDYVGKPVRFASFDQGLEYIKAISQTFGQHTDAQWRKLASDVLRPDGSDWILHYDPGLAVPFKAATPETIERDGLILAATYEAINSPTLLLRGALSDLLSADVAHRMTETGPKASLVEFPDVGHAPTLVHADQIAVIRNFLLRS